jgi:hypothetical protein
MTSYTTTDGARLAYFIDDFTDPWKAPPTLLLHAAMGSAKRYYAWVPTPYRRQFGRRLSRPATGDG